jgi:hypothetical protein
MQKLPPYRGISRAEYLMAARLCPTHPAFILGYEQWTRTTLLEIDRLCRQGKFAAPKQRSS